MKLRVETELEGGKRILTAYAPFDRVLKVLRKTGVNYPISCRELADARLLQLKEHFLNRNGSYTREGFLYAKSEPGLLALISPLTKSIRLAARAVQANKGKMYFSTEDTRLYEEYAKLAEADKNKALKERAVLILPSRSQFAISSTQNEEFFRTLFGKNGAKYLKFAGLDKINVYPLDAKTIDAQSGTTLTELWLRGLDDCSKVYGYDWGLVDGDGVSAVFKTGEVSAQKT